MNLNKVNTHLEEVNLNKVRKILNDFRLKLLLAQTVYAREGSRKRRFPFPFGDVFMMKPNESKSAKDTLCR